MTVTSSFFRQFCVVFLAVVILSGCQRVQPIYQVDNHPIPKLSTPLTLKQIETRIVKAGKLLTWDIRPIEPGKMDGRINWRQHSAVAAIEYDQGSFSIRYKSSYNLLAGTARDDEPHTGQQVIHRQYNNRIRALERAIDTELSFSGL